MAGSDQAKFDVIVRDTPSAPRNFKVDSVKSDHVMLTWEKSQDDGGSDITSYVVERRDASKKNWIESARVHPGCLLRSRVTKLWEGCKYHFRVAAVNELGLSSYAQTDQPVIPKQPFGGSCGSWGRPL